MKEFKNKEEFRIYNEEVDAMVENQKACDEARQADEERKDEDEKEEFQACNDTIALMYRRGLGTE